MPIAQTSGAFIHADYLLISYEVHATEHADLQLICRCPSSLRRPGCWSQCKRPSSSPTQCCSRSKAQSGIMAVMFYLSSQAHDLFMHVSHCLEMSMTQDGQRAGWIDHSLYANDYITCHGALPMSSSLHLLNHDLCCTGSFPSRPESLLQCSL